MDGLKGKVQSALLESYTSGYDHALMDTVTALKMCKEQVGAGAMFSLDDVIEMVSVGLKPKEDK